MVDLCPLNRENDEAVDLPEFPIFFSYISDFQPNPYMYFVNYFHYIYIYILQETLGDFQHILKTFVKVSPQDLTINKMQW